MPDQSRAEKSHQGPVYPVLRTRSLNARLVRVPCHAAPSKGPWGVGLPIDLLVVQGYDVVGMPNYGLDHPLVICLSAALVLKGFRQSLQANSPSISRALKPPLVRGDLYCVLQELSLKDILFCMVA